MPLPFSAGVVSLQNSTNSLFSLRSGRLLNHMCDGYSLYLFKQECKCAYDVSPL